MTWAQLYQGPESLRPMKVARLVRLRGMASLPLVHVGILTVCAENVRCSFLFLDVYSLKTNPIQRLLLGRLAKPVSYSALHHKPQPHVQMYAVTHLHVQLYIRNTLCFQGAAASPSEHSGHQSQTMDLCTYVPMSVVSLDSIISSFH